ncbi:cytochrome P450 [Rhodococcus globerulus]|uniref:Cytochrome P450 n=1 Tax=Rhodococcus globerulus TaxID=33008 RepID=A0ABU4C3E4_RHOGO|nr:cytochrome P450 [Rhodococcus globerulus]MDV6271027.1 cytochrome P450 [Rhodococcus globerulus]
MATIPALAIDPFEDSVLADPSDFFVKLREAGPIVKVEQSEGFDIVAAGRDSIVRAIFEDHDAFISSRGGGILDLARDEPFRTPGVLQETDPPYHSGVRKVMTDIISPRHLRSLKASFQKTADEIVDKLLEMGEFDAHTDLAEAFPLRVIPDAIMGVRPGGRENLLRYSTWLFESMGPRTPRARSVIDSVENIEGALAWVAESTQRENVAENSFGAKLWAAVDEGQLNENEAGLMTRSLVGAGVDTTIYALGLTLNLLVDNPGEYAKLHAQPGLGKFAFDEGMRWGSPVRQIWRTPSRDLEVAGIPIREAQKIMLVMGAANHDPDRWGPTAGDFDVERDSSAQLSFGRGIHQCVGAPIARMEADVLLGTLAKRVKKIERVGKSVPLLNNSLRGWSSIPVRVEAA